MSKESGLRKIKYVVYFLICTVMILTSCSDEILTVDSNGIPFHGMIIFSNMNAYTSIAYDSYTNVIYYYGSNGYICPYYSENGKLCRYIDGQIVEIEQENESED